MLFNSICFEVPGDVTIYLFNIELSFYKNSLTIYLKTNNQFKKQIKINHKYINNIHQFLLNLHDKPNHIFFKYFYNKNIFNY